MIAPLAIPTAATEMAGESYASRERVGVAIGIEDHLLLASDTRRFGGSTTALDEKGVDIGVAHANDLVWSYAAAEESHDAARESEDGILQRVLDVWPQLLLGNVEVKEACVTSRGVSYETGWRRRLEKKERAKVSSRTTSQRLERGERKEKEKKSKEANLQHWDSMAAGGKP
jgi:hypothetical protein